MEKTEIPKLLQKARAGNETAMTQLLELAHGSVIFQCRKIMQHPEDAADMTQEVLLQIYQNLDKLQYPEKFLSWANRIAAHMCLNQRQRHPKDLQFLEDENGHSVLDEIEDADRQHIPDAAMDNAETKRLVTDLIDALPEAQRTAIYLYYYSEMSVREIAALTGVSENTVKSRLNYGRKALKDGFLGYEKDGIKLYSLSPLPFLLLLLRGAAESQADPAAASAAAKAVLTSGAVAAAGAAGASGTTAGSAAAAETTAASAAAGTSAAAAAGAGGILGAVSAKVVAAVLAGVVAVGGITAGVTGWASRTETETTPTQGVTETIPAEPEDPNGPVPIASYTTRRTTVLAVEEIGFIGIELETPLFEEVNEGYRKINAYLDTIHTSFTPQDNSNVAAMLSLYESGSEEAEYIAKYAVVYQDEYYVSLRLTESIWPLETFPMSTRACFTFDVRTGELLELTDLYEGSPEEVAEQIAQVIQDYGYGRYLNNDTYPTASDGFILAASDAEEDRYYSQLAQKKGQPLYYWHLSDSIDDVCIPLPVTLPEFAGNENPAE